ncbi:hypothetical protein KI387_011131, partial [Taxus chinensis]
EEWSTHSEDARDGEGEGNGEEIGKNVQDTTHIPGPEGETLVEHEVENIIQNLAEKEM